VSARVLLISFNRYKQPFPVFPLGLTYVADALIEAGNEVLFVDLNIDETSWVERAAAFSPQLVGISVRNVDEVNIGVTETLLGGLDALVAKCREVCQCPVAIGGPAVSLFPNEILKLCGADYAICGEGERAFAELADAVARGEKLSATWLAKAGEPRIPTPAPSVFCTRCDESIRAKIAPYYIAQSGMLNVQTQRGCPLKCCYCTYPAIEGRIMRRKEVGAVIEELRLIKRNGARYFFIVDGVFNTSNAYVGDLCEAMIRAELNLKWCCFLRPANIDTAFAKLMARAGLAHAECGSDSLSDAMLKNFGKNFSYADALEASRNLMDAGIKICHYVIFGGPGETEATVRETFARSREIFGSIFFSSTGLRVYPGTPIHRMLIKTRPELSDITMLKPYYYVSPEFTESSLTLLIRGEASGRSEWIVPPAPPSIDKDIAKMRRKGILGPLWDYMELMQRFANAREAAERK
jgi:radical SAM superfamily enzyme YgiQ (UPF0313 family)